MSCAGLTTPPDPTRDPTRARRRRELLWGLVRATLFRYSVHNAYRFRRRLLLWFGAQLDPTVRIRPTVRIDRPWNLTMGRNSSLGDGCVLWLRAPIRIGARSVCSQYTMLCTWQVNAPGPELTATARPISIGDDVWVAAECLVTAGSELANGAVVGARSVVRDRLASWMIASGDPAVSRKPRPYRGPTKPPS